MSVCEQTPRKNVQLVNRPSVNTTEVKSCNLIILVRKIIIIYVAVIYQLRKAYVVQNVNVILSYK